MKAIAMLADVGTVASLLVVIVVALAIVVLLVSLWLFRLGRGPQMTRCPYCRKVIQRGATECPYCGRELVVKEIDPEEYLTAED